MESRIAYFSENPSRYAYLVPGSTPLSVAKTAIECLEEMSAEDSKLFAPIMIVATVMRTSALRKFISRPEYATILPIIRMHFSLNGKLNLTAIKLVGHCCLAANIRSANPVIDKVREWIGGQDVWKMDTSKCKIFPEIMDEITKTVLIFSEQEAVINGIKINKAIRIRQGKESPDVVTEETIVENPEPITTSEPMATETLPGYPPMPSFPSVSAFALPPASALKQPTEVTKPMPITETFTMPQLHTLTKPSSVSTTQTPSVSTAFERLKSSLTTELTTMAATMASAPKKTSAMSKEQAILTEPAIPEPQTASFTMPLLTPRMITQMKGKAPMITMSHTAQKPLTTPPRMPTTFPTRLPFLGARAIRPSAPMPMRSAFRVPLSISTESPSRRRQRSPTSESESQPARKRSSVSPSESASSGSSFKLPPKELTDLTVTVRQSITSKEAKEQLQAFQKLTDEMDYGYEGDIIPLAGEVEPVEVALVVEAEKAAGVVEPVDVAVAVEAEKVEEKKDDDDSGTETDNDSDEDEDDDDEGEEDSNEDDATGGD